jgi:uncharacterized protein (TIGR00730 family)
MTSLVYGGGTVGLMGEWHGLSSRSPALRPCTYNTRALIQYEQDGGSNEDAKNPIDEKVYGRTTVVPDMHTRKQLMAKSVIEGGPGSGFVALSGGYGTLEELMEVITWNQLGIHDRAW